MPKISEFKEDKKRLAYNTVVDTQDLADRLKEDDALPDVLWGLIVMRNNKGNKRPARMHINRRSGRVYLVTWSPKKGIEKVHPLSEFQQIWLDHNNEEAVDLLLDIMLSI